jgi:uncharacterized surface protein with fasciclin (FAS1) repeats
MSAGYSTGISITKMSDITQVLPNQRNMATMNRGVIAAGLDEVLSGTGPFTVFAPSDLAFGKVESSTFASLFKPANKVMLTDLLNRHIVIGKYEFKDLKEGIKLKTLDNKEVTVKVSGGFITINGSTIQNRDVPSSNGVIHSLDRILKN